MQDQRCQGMAWDFDNTNPEVRAGACVVMTVLLMYNSSRQVWSQRIATAQPQTNPHC